MAAHSLEYRIYKISSESLLGRKTEQEKKMLGTNPMGRGELISDLLYYLTFLLFNKKL